MVFKAFISNCGISVYISLPEETSLAHLSLIEKEPTALPWPKLRTSWILGNRLLMDHIRRAQQPTVFFPEESYEQRSLAATGQGAAKVGHDWRRLRTHKLYR